MHHAMHLDPQKSYALGDGSFANDDAVNYAFICLLESLKMVSDSVRFQRKWVDSCGDVPCFGWSGFALRNATANSSLWLRAAWAQAAGGRPLHSSMLAT